MLNPPNKKHVEFKSIPININKKTLEPNFSIYVENTPPKEDLLEHHLNSIYPKASSEWVDSDLVLKCQSCSNQFTWYYRKHHCRACGGVFCSNCCNKYTTIPKHLIEIPKETSLLTIQAKQIFTKITGTVSSIATNLVRKSVNSSTNKSLVCNDCYSKINKLLDIQHLIKICEFLDLKNLYNVMTVNKQWSSASIHCISSFRNIQYKPIDYIFNKWECSMLNTLINYLLGHNNWFLLFIKTSLVNDIVHQQNNITKIIDIVKNFSENKNINCWNLMCSRKCNLKLDLLDGIEIIKYISSIPNFSEKFWSKNEFQILIIELFKKIIQINNSKKMISHSIPFISVSLRFLINNSINDPTSFINTLLDLIFQDNYNLLVLLCLEYNCLKHMVTVDNTIKKILNIYHNYLQTKLSQPLKKIIGQTINSLLKLNQDKKILSEITLPILYPFNFNYLITEIIGINELSSSSKPLLVQVIIKKNIGNKLGEPIIKKFIIKNDNQLRKENIVSSLIILLQEKLIQQAKRERIDSFDPIPTYRIIMLNHQIGVIEFLDNCFTLKTIQLKDYTLQNYILENNKDTKIGIIKERFAKSLAISSCLSYVLGLGDRHANNIMVSKFGQIIHIDYGYIMENPIHSNIVNNPIIRISTEMIDFLGGWNSEYYNLFKTYIIQVFDIFRLYSNIIINFYNVLGYDKIMDWDRHKKRLSDRLMNGLSIKDVEVVLLDVIESSSKSYGGNFIDMCNDYGSKIKSWF